MFAAVVFAFIFGTVITPQHICIPLLYLIQLVPISAIALLSITGYVAGEEEDEYYDEIQTIMEDYFHNSEMMSYYIYIPSDEKVMYLWNASGKDTFEHNVWVDYSKDGLEFSNRVFNGDLSEVSKILKSKTYGLITGSIYPIYNSNNEVVALAAANMAIDFIISNVVWFISLVIIGVVVVIAICVALLYAVINRMVLVPVETLNQATKNMVEKIEIPAPVQFNKRVEILHEDSKKDPKKKKRNYLNEVSNRSLQIVCSDLDKAYQRFFENCKKKKRQIMKRIKRRKRQNMKKNYKIEVFLFKSRKERIARSICSTICTSTFKSSLCHCKRTNVAVNNCNIKNSSVFLFSSFRVCICIREESGFN